jgi:hypothetical protein
VSVLKAVKERPEDTILKCFTKETFRVMIYPSITYSLVPEESLYIYKYTFISTNILLYLQIYFYIYKYTLYLQIYFYIYKYTFISTNILLNKIWMSQLYVSAQNLTYHLVLALLTI